MPSGSSRRSAEALRSRRSVVEKSGNNLEQSFGLTGASDVNSASGKFSFLTATEYIKYRGRFNLK
jgi:hypothetical protein